MAAPRFSDGPAAEVVSVVVAVDSVDSAAAAAVVVAAADSAVEPVCHVAVSQHVPLQLEELLLLPGPVPALQQLPVVAVVAVRIAGVVVVEY